MTNYNKAIVLVSGGLDSTTTLAIAKSLGFECYALTFDYGQRHITELDAAKRIVQAFAVQDHKTIKIDLGQIGGSALTDNTIDVPEIHAEGIPATYVPARNTIFLSYALAWAEVLGANDIFIGVNAVDYSGYPDCRPKYIKSYEQLATLATKAGVEGASFKIHTPLINLNKSIIIKQGIELGIDYSITVSCYQADNQGRACGVCDSCRFRKEGFEAAGIPDPTPYR
jgi:7-cyano-7-deazaguanine synthase